MILFHRTTALPFAFSRAALITSDTPTELHATTSKLTIRQREALLDADYHRPKPAPTTWLDTAAEPLRWTNRTGPRQS
ncbi:hypothetical protein [Saccharothrix lopnurensis]|uniref:Uncharacterized protein n=1 Tax=Saccharothrix lopnurensis TaxID=1670621 RepID=A0ABW1PFN2_9PSEU